MVGEQPRRPDQSFDPPSTALSPGARAGIFRGRLVIIGGAGPPGSGLYVYNPSVGAGNLVDSIAASAGTDSQGNIVDAGITTYNPAASGGQTVQLNAGKITFGDPLGADAATHDAGMGRFHVSAHAGLPITFIDGATNDAGPFNPAIWLVGVAQGASNRPAIAVFAGGPAPNSVIFNVVDTLTFGTAAGGLPLNPGPSFNRGSATTLVMATGNTASSTATLLEILGATALKNVAAPATVAGFAEPFAIGGHLDYVAGATGDGQTYSTGRLSLITTSTTLINTIALITITGLSFNVAAAKYRVHGIIRLTAAAAGVTQLFQIQATGTATVSSMLLNLQEFVGHGSHTPVVTTITALNTDPADPLSGVVANNDTASWWIDGEVTFSGAGTFAFGARQVTSAADETATAQIGNFIDLLPS